MTFQFSTIYPITNFSFGTRNQSSTRNFYSTSSFPSWEYQKQHKGSWWSGLIIFNTMQSGCRIGDFNHMNTRPKVIEAKRILFNMGYGWTGVLFLFFFFFPFPFLHGFWILSHMYHSVYIVFYVSFRLLHPSDLVSGLTDWYINVLGELSR
ncbi:hypothetical protein BDV10DRAFT_99337 [Aspergillus recurvatus]